jgi:hypothetical protein
MRSAEPNEEQNIDRTVLYRSVSEFICRTVEINEESQHKIRFRVREKRIKTASRRRRKLSLSGKIYRPERKIIQENRALTLFFRYVVDCSEV